MASGPSGGKAAATFPTGGDQQTVEVKFCGSLISDWT